MEAARRFIRENLITGKYPHHLLLSVPAQGSRMAYKARIRFKRPVGEARLAFFFPPDARGNFSTSLHPPNCSKDLSPKRQAGNLLRIPRMAGSGLTIHAEEGSVIFFPQPESHSSLESGTI